MQTQKMFSNMAHKTISYRNVPITLLSKSYVMLRLYSLPNIANYRDVVLRCKPLQRLIFSFYCADEDSIGKDRKLL